MPSSALSVSKHPEITNEAEGQSHKGNEPADNSSVRTRPSIVRLTHRAYANHRASDGLANGVADYPVSQRHHKCPKENQICAAYVILRVAFRRSNQAHAEKRGNGDEIYQECAAPFPVGREPQSNCLLSATTRP
jgi:hypothetical protein